MSFSMHLANLSSEQIAFSYSPAHETILALHVFDDCKHHPLHIPWVINARKKVSSGLKEEIDAFSLFYQRPIISYWGHQGTAFRSFDKELQGFLELPIEEFYQKIVDSIRSHSGLQLEFFEKAIERYPKSHNVLLGLLENPDEVRLRFTHLLKAFWDACLREEWPRVEELFLKDITFRGKKLMNEGPLPLLESLSPEIVIDSKKKRAVIRRISKADIFFEEEEVLLLTPSYFVWPHLLVNRRNPVGINYSIMENQQEAIKPMPPENLLKFFRAMGDLTRLQMVQFLAEKPRSTRELAALIGVTEGAVSKHLKQLQDAELITSRRESYYVFYQLQYEAFNEFPVGLQQFIQLD
ncbi:ArsR/SmtB family transcription factor [Neobacillus bataviensis]|uniref:ArsR/SmtB family transcription factor n=1 Tax=Neobacillus bataviensis TaxID=220685 RepID=UPI001CBF1C2C|nr:DUF5937 family protein [Neobacillus bataviensis]